jgi:hypothetical protein
MIGKICIIRTFSAGVHIGTVKSIDDKAVVLNNATRIWSWNEANTLSELSQKGGGKATRISEPVPEILLTEAIEIIPCAPKASKMLLKPQWS